MPEGSGLFAARTPRLPRIHANRVELAQLHAASISHEAGGTEPEAMGAPRQHPMAMEATARFGGHTACRRGAGRCHVRVRVSRTLSSCRQPLSYFAAPNRRISTFIHFLVAHPQQSETRMNLVPAA